MRLPHSVNPFYAARQANPFTASSTKPLVLDLFSGIGGFWLGLERAGFKTAAFCEIDPFCRQVLAGHWPGVPLYHDIHQLNKRKLQHGVRPITHQPA